MQVENHFSYEIYPLLEGAVTLQFEQKIDEKSSAYITTLRKKINQKPFEGFATAVQAYCSLSIFYHPQKLKFSSLVGENNLEKIKNYLLELLDEPFLIEEESARTIEIPVYYGGFYGPDLDELALKTKLAVSEIIHIHSTTLYRVYMIGFVPGFAYLGGLDERLYCARKAVPRAHIPAGSVGIGGQQTGIYPLATPGGWQIIGATPLTLFDAYKPTPSLLQAGDVVKFKPITQQQFETDYK